MKIRPLTVFTFALTLIFAGALLISIKYPIAEGFYVWVGVTLGLIVCVLELTNQIRATMAARAPKVEPASTSGESKERTVPKSSSYMRGITLFLWFAALYGVIWLVGFKSGIAIFFLSYLIFRARIRWSKSLILTAIAMLFLIYFDFVLHAFWPEGILKEWLPWLP